VQVSDLPLSVIFLFFLFLFLLFDLYPGRKGSAAKIRKLLGRRDVQEESDTEILEPGRVRSSSDRQAALQLNDFESIVLMQFAQNSGKRLPCKQINAALHLEPPIFETTLESLLRKGVIRMSMTPLLGIRCQLSEKGHDYLMEQGCIPRILGRTGRPFPDSGGSGEQG